MDYQTISEYVDSHSEEATTFLQNYLRIPSPTGQEKESALTSLVFWRITDLTPNF